MLPIFDKILRFKLSDNETFTNLPSPSVVFKKIFPVKPSVTTALTLPEKASLPSIFPIKFIPSSGDFSLIPHFLQTLQSIPSPWLAIKPC